MPLHVFWDDEAKTIIRSEGEGAWTWQEFHEGLGKIVEMMKTVPHRVDLIHSPRPNSQRPPGSGMPHFQRAARVMPPNAGLNIFVSTNTFGRAIVNIFARLYGSKKFVMAGSLEEARAMIAKDRRGVVNVK